MFSMPGSYPSSSRNGPEQRHQSISATATQEAMDVINSDNLNQFASHQQLIKKTLRQKHLINQLDTLVYILVGYQFIKYCHSAALVPVIAHVTVEKIICSEAITSESSQTPTFLSFVSDLRSSMIENGQDPEPTVTGILRKVGTSIYWKCLLIILYHILFICYWLIPLANSHRLDQLINGTWWFISFIGEEAPSPETFQSLSYFGKMVHLGLVGLIVSDIMIFFIQLTIFQAVSRQSTISPLGRPLGTPEIEILRVSGDNSGKYQEDEDPPLALVIKLYESLNLASLIPSGDTPL